MKKAVRVTFCFQATVLLFFLSGIFSMADIAETVIGKVYEVHSDEQYLTVAITNPDTEVTRILQIQIDFDTNFVHIGSLSDLKPGRGVKIDFFQAKGGQFVAKQITAALSVEEEEEEEEKTTHGVPRF